jgi:uncharacterized protein
VTTSPAAPRVQPRQSRFSIGLLLSLFLTVLFIGAIVLYGRITGVDDPYSKLDLRFVLFIIVYTLVEILLIVRFGINKYGGLSLKQIGWRFDNWKTNVAVGILGGLIAVCAIYLVGLGFKSWDWSSFLTQQANLTSSQRVLFLLIGLNASFIEESLFRGFLQPAAIDKFGYLLGIVFTALIFTIYHLQFLPQALAGKFVLGFIFGVLRSRDKSLIRPAIAHTIMWVLIGSL